MPDIVTVTETSHLLATEHGLTVSPHELSTLIYRRVLGPELAPMIGGRRMIAVRDLPLVADVIRGRSVASQHASSSAQP